MSGETVARMADLECNLDALSPQELTQLLGELERLRAAAWARLAAVAANGQGQPAGGLPGQAGQADTLLDAKQAAQRLSLSTDYLYRHAKTLPFTVRVGRQLRFSAQGIQNYIRLQQRR